MSELEQESIELGGTQERAEAAGWNYSWCMSQPVLTAYGETRPGNFLLPQWNFLHHFEANCVGML